jgi:hypothetical protein
LPIRFVVERDEPGRRIVRPLDNALVGTDNCRESPTRAPTSSSCTPSAASMSSAAGMLSTQFCVSTIACNTAETNATKFGASTLDDGNSPR